VLRQLIHRALRGRHQDAGPTPVTLDTPSEWTLADSDLAHDFGECINPILREAIRERDVAALLTPFGPGLWSIPVLSSSGCRRLTMAINQRLAWQAQHPQHSPNSMHYAGVVLEPMGLSKAATLLRESVVEPLRPILYPEAEQLDSEYGFAATYGPTLDRRLGFHVDDSEVTLNIALGDGYRGGEIIFQGRRCANHRQDAHRPEEEIAVTIPVGHGLLHAGNHRHLVTTVHGERRNLILWCRSSATRAKTTDECAPWCGHRDG